MNTEWYNFRQSVNTYGFFIASILLASSWYIFVTYGPQVPCTKPIPYKIGTIDSRFNISQSELRKAIWSATDIWNKAAGKTLFVESDSGIVINLSYDERQSFSSYANTLDQQLSKEQNKITNAALAYQTKQRLYEAQLADFNNDVKEYNKNKTDVVYEQLLARQKELERMNTEINVLIDAHNTLAENFNSTIKEYNSNPLIGKPFEAGLYQQDENGSKKIEIFEYENNNKLIRILAHEFGHALSIEHNANKNSIMYELNSANTLSLTPEDLSALTHVCNPTK